MITRRAALAAIPGLATMTTKTRSHAATPLTVFELRNYRARPGRRDDLIAMFEAHFLDAYTRAGATVLGTFRNPDEPNRWFWIRAFPDIASRPSILKGFYTSQDWLTRADACNATIADTSDAYLMRMASPPVIALPETPKVAAIAPSRTDAQIELLIYPLKPGEEAAGANWIDVHATPSLSALGQAPILTLKPQPLDGVPNRKSLRDDPVLAVFIRHASGAEFDASGIARMESAPWRVAEASLKKFLAGPVLRRRLMPTDRSWLR